MQESTKRKIHWLNKKLGHLPSILIYILPGQPPGRYFAEHDRRIIKALQVWQECLSLSCKVTILCTSGPADANGLTCAKYMRNQLIYFAQKLHLSNVEPYIEIGEEKSGSTAQQILYSKDDLKQRKPDLVILVSNRPHLLVAASYFKHIIGGRFVKEWSANSDGCIGMPLIPFFIRELQHYFATITIDRSGHRFDNIVNNSIQKWQKLIYPPIPPPESS